MQSKSILHQKQGILLCTEPTFKRGSVMYYNPHRFYIFTQVLLRTCPIPDNYPQNPSTNPR